MYKYARRFRYFLTSLRRESFLISINLAMVRIGCSGSQSMRFYILLMFFSWTVLLSSYIVVTFWDVIPYAMLCVIFNILYIWYHRTFPVQLKKKLNSKLHSKQNKHTLFTKKHKKRFLLYTWVWKIPKKTNLVFWPIVLSPKMQTFVSLIFHWKILTESVRMRSTGRNFFTQLRNDCNFTL